MTPYLQDADCTLYHGDVLDVLRQLPDASVDCCVTSPPYWGLRDYGTGEWEGGNPECDHVAPLGGGTKASGLKHPDNSLTQETIDAKVERLRGQYRDICGKCGATRTDQQLGLEPTPEEYVARMVEVFREVRRVLAPHGTVWLNLGDSYNANQGKGFNGQVRQDHANRHTVMKRTGFKPKDLVGIPWRVAFALQADGWYLRSDIIWAKPNPMPESVTDRPTKAHEYVFLLSKQPRYFFDQEAVREPYLPSSIARSAYALQDIRSGTATRVAGEKGPKGDTMVTREYPPLNPTGRNIRSVWEIATQPYPEAHFATFPEELARRCIAAGCPEQVCRMCGKARERITSTEYVQHRKGGKWQERQQDDRGSARSPAFSAKGTGRNEVSTVGFTDCGHSDYRPGIVLDPFIGSGTVAFVARKLGRHSIGIDLNESYLALAAKRLQQQSLFAEV